jgi:hypothetical protein
MKASVWSVVLFFIAVAATGAARSQRLEVRSERGGAEKPLVFLLKDGEYVLKKDAQFGQIRGEFLREEIQRRIDVDADRAPEKPGVSTPVELVLGERDGIPVKVMMKLPASSIKTDDRWDIVASAFSEGLAIDDTTISECSGERACTKWCIKSEKRYCCRYGCK